MHTDESWLSGLSRSMTAEASPAATEYFFNLVHRAPHAIKILYHGIQILFIRLFGYSLLSVRLLSLAGGAAALAVFTELLKRIRLPQLPGVIILSAQIQFIYASHFARQEILLLLLMLCSLTALFTGTGEASRPVSARLPGFRRGLLVGLPVALATGLHPNAFIIAWPAGLCLLGAVITRRRPLSEGLGFLLPPAASAALLLLLSRSFNAAL